MCVRVHVHSCVHTLPQQTSNASPVKEGKDSGMAKNSRRQTQSKCVFPKLVPTNLRDPSMFFYGLYPGGLVSVC